MGVGGEMPKGPGPDDKGTRALYYFTSWASVRIGLAMCFNGLQLWRK